MRSFSSSAVNKSGKKFAPKAPVRRAPAPAPAPAAPRRPSIVRQTPPQPEKPVADVTAPTLEPPAPAPAANPPAPTGTATESTVSEDVPPQRKIPPPSRSATAVPIPAPKQRPSVSASAVKVPEPATAPRQTAPQGSSTVIPEPTPIPSIENESQVIIEGVPAAEGPQVPKRPSTSSISDVQSRLRRPSETTTEVRPAKRPKTIVQDTTIVKRNQPVPDQIATPPVTQPAASEADETNGTPSETHTATAGDRKAAKPRRRKSTTEGTRRPRGRKERQKTPEGAESIEIAPAVVKMSDLCKDLRTGKLSKREMELRNMELAELERKEWAKKEGETVSQTAVKHNGEASAAPAEEDSLAVNKQQAGPVMRIVNGEIVLDAASLQVDRHADAARDAGELEDVVETSLSRKINQASYGKRSKTESWDEEMTDLFYRGLRIFGTNFMMISKLFPGRSRRQIKLKFNNEERRDPERIKQTLLGPSETIDIATFSEMTNTTYADPKVIQRELDEERKRIEDQHTKEKEAHEELLRNPDGAKDPADAEGNDASIKGKGRNNKKQTLKQTGGGGTEEILGSIDEFPFQN